MNKLKIPDRKRLIAEVLPPGEKPKDYMNAFGHVVADRRTLSNPHELSCEGQFVGLEMYGIGRDGNRVGKRIVRVPEGCLFQPFRERAAVYSIFTRLVLHELTKDKPS